MSETKKEFSRLPTVVVPSLYKLELKPCLTSFTFIGTVDIDVQVNDVTDEVKMNCLDIEIKTAAFKSDNDDCKFLATSIAYDVDEETVTLKFPQTLNKGKATLSIAFTGILNDKMRGFYRSKYTLDGITKYSAVTQFEATDARRSFPCWDEPAIKAKFEVTLIVPKDLVALSNMSEKHVTELLDENLKSVQFFPTPLMSTYLLAFVVGEYDFVEKTSQHGVKIRVYTPLKKSKQGCFALEVADKALTFFSNYFDISYPMDKLDLIAIADFTCGAMENWGLVTYRETAVLIDEKSSSAAARQYVAIVVCHELAHQWFGNLVTMEWWTHLWLNEGFASFMEYLATDHCHPEFKIWTQFITDDLIRAMKLDSLDSSHAIEIPVGHPDEVEEIFDTISYNKGSSVIRMLNNWIGDEKFKQGLHNYLVKHSYSNTFTEDLWQALGDSSGKPVLEVMSTWTNQMGYPVIDVSVKNETSTSVTLSISQSKFSFLDETENGKEVLWSIPLSFYTDSISSIGFHLMSDKTDEITVEKNDLKFVKFNPNVNGFYRVCYSSDLLKYLIDAISHKSMPVTDRLNIENDLFSLAAAGKSSTADFLSILSAFDDEVDFCIWNDICQNIGLLKNMMMNDEETGVLFQKFVLKRLVKIHDKLGWESSAQDDHLTNLLRSKVIEMMGSFGDQKVLEQSLKMFNAHVNKEKLLNADMRSAIYQNVASFSNQKVFDDFIELHKNADIHEEKNRIEKCMGNVTTPELIKQAFDFAMSDSVRNNDRVWLIGSVAKGSKLGRDMTWEFVKENYSKLFEMYKGSSILARLAKFTTEGFSTEGMAKEIKTFFETNPKEAIERTVDQAVEHISHKAIWWKRDFKIIKDFLTADSVEKSL